MANSPRTAAPCSARSAVLINDGAFPSPIDHRPLMSLRAIIDRLSGVDGAIAALCELLDAAGGARVHAAHIDALLAPVQRQLSEACDDLKDLPLLELSEGMRPMLAGEVLLSAPQKLTYEFYTSCGACCLRLEGEGFTHSLHRFHVPLNGDVRYWNLGHWLSCEERTDHLGQIWSTRSTYVTDDFGTLVLLLEGGAA